MHNNAMRPFAGLLALANLLHAMLMRSNSPAHAAREERETLTEMCAHRTDSTASAQTRRAKHRANPTRPPPSFLVAPCSVDFCFCSDRGFVLLCFACMHCRPRHPHPRPPASDPRPPRPPTPARCIPLMSPAISAPDDPWLTSDDRGLQPRPMSRPRPRKARPINLLKPTWAAPAPPPATARGRRRGRPGAYPMSRATRTPATAPPKSAKAGPTVPMQMLESSPSLGVCIADRPPPRYAGGWHTQREDS